MKCTGKLLGTLTGEGRLGNSGDEDAGHYHVDRPHRGLGNRRIKGPPNVTRARGVNRLSGSLRSFHRVGA